MVRVSPSGFVVDLAEIAGRPVAVGGDDFSVRGGATSGYRLRGGHNGFSATSPSSTAFR